MPIKHHPDDATLMSFASGALPEAHSAVVSTHLMSCGGCRQSVRDLEFVGAALFAELPDIDFGAQRPGIDLGYCTSPATDEGEADEVLDPIYRLTGHHIDDIPWKRLGWGIWHYPIKTRNVRAGDLRLLKVQNGQSMPEHGHGGNELTLVVQGAYTDEFGTFAAGDVADLDDTVEHRPVADQKTGCICLVASESKTRLKSVVGRLLQPLAGF